MQQYSVIIPSLNEGLWIDGTIRHVLKLNGDAQIIIADGGSTDNTRNLARKAGAEVLISSVGRGIQCNAGAVLARTAILVFLHADTRLPEEGLTFSRVLFRILQ